MASKISKEEIDIINQFHKAMRKYGWKPMESKYGSAWFGGKSHKGLQKYIPEEKLEHFEDIDFLVMGWADEYKNDRQVKENKEIENAK